MLLLLPDEVDKNEDDVEATHAPETARLERGDGPRVFSARE